jgi:multicomponent Na+:H+ antiporter subunit B
MMSVIGLMTLTLLAIAAIATVMASNLFISSMWFGIFSLLMASNFFILDAADVALTEAAVGAGVSTVLFMGALALTGDKEVKNKLNWLAVVVLGVLAFALFIATFDQPRLGDPNAPVHMHVAPWYLEQTPNLINIPNVVTAILASFRGYDTLGEVLVIFTAGIGVLSVLGFKPKHRPVTSGEAFGEKVRGVQHHAILRVVGKLVIPVLMLFALVVQFHGKYTPGGGFSAGALFAAAVMLYGILEGADRSSKAMPQLAMLRLAAFGATLYAGVGLVCMLLGGAFLDYNVLWPDPLIGQYVGILLVEFGVGLTVTTVLIMIFNAIANRPTY